MSKPQFPRQRHHRPKPTVRLAPYECQPSQNPEIRRKITWLDGDGKYIQTTIDHPLVINEDGTFHLCRKGVVLFTVEWNRLKTKPFKP